MKYIASSTGSGAKLLLICGVLACPVFVLSFIIQGALRPHYNPYRHAVSSLSIGKYGWVQRANFIVAGVLLMLFALGLRVNAKPSKSLNMAVLLFRAIGFCFISAGIFSSDPVYGYPTCLPLRLKQFTIHGHLHEFFSILIFVGLSLTCFELRSDFLDKNENGLAAYSAFTALATLSTFIIGSLGFEQIQARFTDYAGVFQRLSIIIGGTWVTWFAVHESLGRHDMIREFP